ncbi:hypothetical protein K437DRAFT_145518 [Tilletiaria anomala UBC 951]|uniref:Uncharacterized protein n=1 Tax=Tilletiaria anomala (strain ATCC 24038 / CBS 436.72 / UBC 951) TaxID=1037660 RepID=A0A066VR58_TILAU|nr:uncharacterized protein K437DRAFT_145518 [Tilletiaria anomala UBC 951]KDN43931.1 hypothetical protein K437DRAFT_145518 [Tilletiaria anomala UBC 951]
MQIALAAVGTNPHRHREDPDDHKKHKMPSALTIEVFLRELVQGRRRDRDLISGGSGAAGRDGCQVWTRPPPSPSQRSDQNLLVDDANAGRRHCLACHTALQLLVPNHGGYMQLAGRKVRTIVRNP